MCPEILEQHLQLTCSKMDSCAEVRAEVRAYVELKAGEKIVEDKGSESKTGAHASEHLDAFAGQ